jgi:hypothetical protein
VARTPLFAKNIGQNLVVIQSGDNKSMDQLFGAVHIKVSTDTADAVQVGESTLTNLLPMNSHIHVFVEPCTNIPHSISTRYSLSVHLDVRHG